MRHAVRMNDRSPPGIDALPETELGRLADIAKVAAAQGLGRYAERLGLRRHGAAASGPASDAARFRQTLEALGPTFVKLGQMMAGRSDIFPEELIAELGRLHEHAPEFAGDLARATVEAETGKRIEDLYASFDDRPMAAASMAQVHCATLFDGTEVIVKVQRPGIAATVEADIAVLRRLARLLGSAIPSLRALNLPDLVEELAETLRGELDFEREGRNAERFAALNADEPAVIVPRIFWHATTRRVLTMEHSPGGRIDAAPADAARKAETAQTLMRLFLVQVFEHGVFHGDPHPGNIFLLEDGRLCFHDFGALGELSPQVQEKLRELFLAVLARDAGWVASAYLGMGGPRASSSAPSSRATSAPRSSAITANRASAGSPSARSSTSSCASAGAIASACCARRRCSCAPLPSSRRWCARSIRSSARSGRSARTAHGCSSMRLRPTLAWRASRSSTVRAWR